MALNDTISAIASKETSNLLNPHLPKLVVSGSLEEKIIEMQERKKGLISALLDFNANIGSNLSMEDLEDIFKPLPPPILMIAQSKKLG